MCPAWHNFSDGHSEEAGAPFFFSDRQVLLLWLAAMAATYYKGNEKGKQKGVIIVKMHFFFSKKSLLAASLLSLFYNLSKKVWKGSEYSYFFSCLLTFFIVSFSNRILSLHFPLFKSLWFSVSSKLPAVSTQGPPFLSTYLPFAFVGSQDNSGQQVSPGKLLHKAGSALSWIKAVQGFYLCKSWNYPRMETAWPPWTATTKPFPVFLPKFCHW